MPKSLIVCADGTWGRGTATNPTNVVRMRDAIIDDGTTQKVFYDEGVGSSGPLWKRAIDGAIGRGLGENVKDAYRPLVEHYEDGDRIYFFGFSRGAFTVRSAAGMIRKCGLLKREHLGLVDKAFDIYGKRDDTPDTEEAKEFRKRYSYDPVPIEFIGVWDTVGALGVPSNLFWWFNRWMFKFHDVQLSSRVKHAYQAIAIDEKRKNFKPTLWEVDAASAGQQLEQVWFAGCHSGVGGGDGSVGLPHVALRWLYRKAEPTGLKFKPQETAKWNPDSLGKLKESWKFPWFFVSKQPRPIGTGKYPEEAIASTVEERYLGDPRYRPTNFAKYLRRKGQIPGESLVTTKVD